ncbi:MAG: amidase [Alphaproteobacteria bacterium]|nr:amidase [Alphaproteobacteria bacterium]
MRKSSAFVPHDLAAAIKGAGGGPLSGLIASVKDMYDIKGTRTGGGSPEWLAAGTPALKHAAPVQRLIDAGADIVGKTVCDEFFFSLTGANAHYGTPVNVRAVGRMPGGSSGGSAAATGAGACDLALGSDTGGSMRVPASFCGVYGIRPTMGRVAMDGTMGMAPTFDVPGWFAGSPGIFRKAGAVLLNGETRPAKVTRLVVFRDGFDQADASVAAVLHAFLARAYDVLPTREEAIVAPDGFAEWREIFRTIQGREMWTLYGAWIEQHRPNLGPGIKERIAYAATISQDAASAARTALAKVRAHIRSLIPQGTLACIPTAPTIAPRIDATPQSLEGFRASAMALTSIAGLSGLPQISIPAATVDGCPAGLSLIGWAGADETLLDMAVTLGPYCGADAS